MSEAERRRMPGMNPRRADIIVAGNAVLIGALALLGCDEIVVCERALRDGVVVDLAQRDRAAFPAFRRRARAASRGGGSGSRTATNTSAATSVTSRGSRSCSSSASHRCTASPRPIATSLGGGDAAQHRPLRRAPAATTSMRRTSIRNSPLCRLARRRARAGRAGRALLSQGDAQTCRIPNSSRSLRPIGAASRAGLDPADRRRPGRPPPRTGCGPLGASPRSGSFGSSRRPTATCRAKSKPRWRRPICSSVPSGCASGRGARGRARVTAPPRKRSCSSTTRPRSSTRCATTSRRTVTPYHRRRRAHRRDARAERAPGPRRARHHAPAAGRHRGL